MPTFVNSLSSIESAVLTVGTILFLATILVMTAYLRRARRTSRTNVRTGAGQSRPQTPSKDSILTPKTTSTISRAEIEREYGRRKAKHEQWQRRVSGRIAELKRGRQESAAPELLLSVASAEERANLAAVLSIPGAASCPEIVEALRRAGSHVVGNLFRRGLPIGYADVVLDVAKRLGVSPPPAVSPIFIGERAVLNAAFQKTLECASPEQRRAILEALARSDGKGGVGVVGAAGTLVLGHLSGFALYTAASTALAAVTGAIGITLPFAAYMGMSSALATIMGPFGWAALGGWAIYKMGGPDFKKTIPGVITIAAARSRLIAERDREIECLTAEGNQAIAAESRRLDRLKEFLESMPNSHPDFRIPISDLPKGL